MILNNPKDFKWLRLVLTGLKGHPFFYTEGNFALGANPPTLTIFADHVVITMIAENTEIVQFKAAVFVRGKKSPVLDIREDYYKSTEAIELAKVRLEEYLNNNPSMREWGEREKIITKYKLYSGAIPTHEELVKMIPAKKS